MATPEGYEQKFAQLIQACEDTAKDDVILVHHPQVLGDDYEEIVESLNRIADAEARLVIVPRDQRSPDHGRGASPEDMLCRSN
jgi:hypothetical protein